MIYVIGMSHAINVLKACSREPLSFSHDDWSFFSTEGKFFDLTIKPGVFPDDHFKVFIISRAAGWGQIAELQTKDGKNIVAAVPGFCDLLESIKVAQDNGILITFINGNDHSVLSLLQHPIPYDFLLPWRSDLDLMPGRQPVPLDVITRQMESALNSTIATLTFMRISLPKMRILHVMPPPPMASEEQIRKAPEVFGDKIRQCGITPLPIRIKYYLLYQEVIGRTLSNLGIEAIMPPDKALNPDGSLADQYVYGCTHGNDLYGSLVVDQIATFIKDRGQ